MQLSQAKRAETDRRALPAGFASLAVGALLPLAFAPFGLWWLAPLLVAGYAFLWLTATPRQAFWRGFAFGAGAFLAGTYWLYHSIVTIGQTPLALALVLMLGLVAIMALYYGANAALIVWLARGRRGPVLLLLPAVWVQSEWLRGWVLSGFPWLSLGYTLPTTPLGGWLPLGGVYAGSLVLATIGTLLLLAATAAGRARVAAIVGVLVLLLISVAIGPMRWVDEQPRSLNVSVGQLGLDQSLKWQPDQFRATLEWYAQFVVDNEQADLLVMPEAAIPALASRVEFYLSQLSDLTTARGQSLVLGILRPSAQGQPANALLALGDGQRQWYEKRHLVPFGEFFPVPAIVREWMRLRGLPYADIKRGADRQTPLQVAGVPVATSICYEDAYAAEQLDFFPDARFIINVSNDAWFGDSIAPHQHLQIARTRSAEAQRWQVRSTNAGITAIIDAKGRVVTRVNAFEPAVLSGELRLSRGHTPYTRFGNWPVLLITWIGLLGAGFWRRNGTDGLPRRD